MPVKQPEDCHTCHMTEPIALADLIRTHPLRSTGGNKSGPNANKGEAIQTTSLASSSARPPGSFHVHTNGSSNVPPPPPPPNSGGHVNYARPNKISKNGVSNSQMSAVRKVSDNSVHASDLDPIDSFLHSPRLQRMIVQSHPDPNYEELNKYSRRKDRKSKIKSSSISAKVSKPSVSRTSSTSSDRSVHFDPKDSIQKKPIIPNKSSVAPVILPGTKNANQSESTSSLSGHESSDVEKKNTIEVVPSRFTDAQVQTYDVLPSSGRAGLFMSSDATKTSKGNASKLTGMALLSSLLRNRLHSSTCCPRRRMILAFIIGGYSLLMVLTIVIGVAVIHVSTPENSLLDSDLRTAGVRLVPATSIGESSQSIRERLPLLVREGTASSDSVGFQSGTNEESTRITTPLDFDRTHHNFVNTQSNNGLLIPHSPKSQFGVSNSNNRAINNVLSTIHPSRFPKQKVLLPDSTLSTLDSLNLPPVSEPTSNNIDLSNRRVIVSDKIRPTILEDAFAINSKEKPQIKKPEEPGHASIIRSWSHTNSDGTFSYGYINSDGSFKNETRGQDCVVNGVFGYVDPKTGARLSFPYTSGNPCTPGSPQATEHPISPQSATKQSQPKTPTVSTPPRRPNVVLRPISDEEQLALIQQQLQRFSKPLQNQQPLSLEQQQRQRQLFLEQKKRQEQLQRKILLQQQKIAQQQQEQAITPRLGVTKEHGNQQDTALRPGIQNQQNVKQRHQVTQQKQPIQQSTARKEPEQNQKLDEQRRQAHQLLLQHLQRQQHQKDQQELQHQEQLKRQQELQRQQQPKQQQELQHQEQLKRQQELQRQQQPKHQQELQRQQQPKHQQELQHQEQLKRQQELQRQQQLKQQQELHRQQQLKQQQDLQHQEQLKQQQELQHQEQLKQQQELQRQQLLKQQQQNTPAEAPPVSQTSESKPARLLHQSVSPQPITAQSTLQQDRLNELTQQQQEAQRHRQSLLAHQRALRQQLRLQQLQRLQIQRSQNLVTNQQQQQESQATANQQSDPTQQNIQITSVPLLRKMNFDSLQHVQQLKQNSPQRIVLHRHQQHFAPQHQADTRPRGKELNQQQAPSQVTPLIIKADIQHSTSDQQAEELLQKHIEKNEQLLKQQIQDQQALFQFQLQQQSKQKLDQIQQHMELIQHLEKQRETGNINSQSKPQEENAKR